MGYSEQAKCSQIAKVFDDAYKVSQAAAAAAQALESRYAVHALKQAGACWPCLPAHPRVRCSCKG